MSNKKETPITQTQEELIDPELAICDTHHHLWNSNDKRYLLKDLLQDIGRVHNIVQTVIIESESVEINDLSQAMLPVKETRFANDMANESFIEKTKVAAGIVGFANLLLGSAVSPVLEGHLAASYRFRGIRQICSWDAHHDVIMSTSAPGLLLEPKFREGLSCLKQYNLSFETFLYHPQLMELVDLARAFPEIPVILEHTGGPLHIGPYAGKHDEIFQEWKASMAALATCPNTIVKLGGLGMPFTGFNWHERAVQPNSTELADAMAPYFLWCIERFGVKRCMFESNFPVDKMSYSYTTVWNAFKILTKSFSKEERKALFYDSAIRVYRL
jgi:L-fuconolactonase